MNFQVPKDQADRHLDGLEPVTLETDAVAEETQHPRPPRTLSEIFVDLGAEGRERVSIGDLAHALRDRSFGAFLLVFSIPCLLPFPPFTTVLLGMPITIITWQMMLGRDQIWLPGFLTRRAVSGRRYNELLAKGLPILRRIERRVKPRYWMLFRNNPWMLRAVYIFCFVTAVTVVLPIPFGNWLPAFGCAFFGAALSQRDGLWIGVAALVSGLAISIAAVVVFFAWQASAGFMAWFGL
ncbi:MAG: exopolysaccharide biosynthesis protein [Pseudomonadota bacterium]